MRLEQFIQVLEIAKVGSINKAAQNLFLSQPSLSQSLKSFEKEVGIQIFTRENKGMVLTEDGRQLISIMEPLYNQLIMVPQLFRQSKPVEYKTFSVSNAYLKYVFNVYQEMVDAFEKDGLRSYYREVSGGEVLEDVVSQRSSVGVLFITSSLKNFMLKLFDYKEVDYHKLSDGGYWLILGPKNPLYHQNKGYVTPEEIREFPLVIYESMYKPLPYGNEYFLESFSNKSVLHVNSRASMIELVSNTNAVNLGAGSKIPYTQTPFYPGLKTVELRMESYQQEVGWICRKNYQPS